MKFNSFDELISFLYGKDLTTLNFEITDDVVQAPAAPTVPPVLPSQPPAGGVAMGANRPQNVGVTFNSFSDKPVVEFALGERSLMLVDDFEHIPNTCSTTKVNVAGRELTIGVCESADGLAVAKFDVVVEGKLYCGKEFVLATDATKYKNTINIHD